MIAIGSNVTSKEERASGTDDGFFGTPYVLEAVTLSCTAEEVGNLLRFLESTKSRCIGAEGFCSGQLRDWDPGWSEEECDVEIMFNVGTHNGGELA